MLRVQWIHHTEEVTWEIETYLPRKHSRLPLNQFTYLIFQSFSILESRDEILFRGKAVTIQILCARITQLKYSFCVYDYLKI